MQVCCAHLTGDILHVNLTFPATEAAPEYFTVGCKHTGKMSVSCASTQYSLLCHSLPNKEPEDIQLHKCLTFIFEKQQLGNENSQGVDQGNGQ